MHLHHQTPREELVNAVTHGIGAVLGLGALAWMTWGALEAGGGAVSVGAAVIYGLSLVVLFGGSAAYHAVWHPEWKRALQTVDHCAIYGLIAGTYTPFALVSLGGPIGWLLFGVLWALAVAGITLELVVAERWERVSLGLYVTMGWLGVLAIVPLVQAVPVGALALVALGGVIYTAGIAFYARNRPWDHVVWHGFVLGGASAHGAAVLGWVC